jgi:hypothetical protein
MNLPICGAVAAAMIFIQVPDESVPLEGSLTHALLYKMDLIGFSILAPSSIMFLLALAYGGVDHPWDSATVIGLFCGGGVGFILFFIWEERVGTDGMFPSILLRRRIVWASCVSQMMFFGAILVGSFFLSIYFQSVKGESPLGAGVNVLPVTLVQVFSVLVSGALSESLFSSFLDYMLRLLSHQLLTATQLRDSATICLFRLQEGSSLLSASVFFLLSTGAPRQPNGLVTRSSWA